MSTAGAAGAEDVFGLLEAQAAAHPAHVATRSRRGGSWVWTTWGDFHDAARSVALSLIDAGVAHGDRVALMSSTREEWTVIDFAALAVGAVTVPVYPTATAEQLAHLLRDSVSTTVVIENDAQLETVNGAVVAGARPRRIILFDPDARAKENAEVPVLSYWDLVRRGRTRLESSEGTAIFAARRGAVTGESLATIVYTSGTTGPPRGVMLTHTALLSQTRALLESFIVGQDDEQLLILPLAHILARVLCLAHVASGSRLAYAAGPQRLLRDLAETEPTFFATVPRFLEKIYTVSNESARAEGPLKAALWSWALDVGKRRVDRHLKGEKPKRLFSAQARYADKLVLARVRATFGKRLRFVISGGAPLSRELAEWLGACGVTVLEGYGLTEVGGASHANRVGRARLGTVGRPLPGYESKLGDDGEVLLRGPSLMTGYVGNASATRASIDGEGWLHTGDIGRIDEEGFLTVVDRKKDVIVTAGGSNVAPQNIENLLLSSPWLKRAVVVGDRRPYLVALVTLDVAVCERWARERGRATDAASLRGDPELVALVQLDVDAVNGRLSSFETIKRFAILPEDFSRESGELTELGKLRREVIRARHAETIEALYG